MKKFSSFTNRGFSPIKTKKVEELTLSEWIIILWDYNRKIQQILSKFKITDLNQKVGNLSGGQKKRLSLSLLLIEESDIFY